MNFVNLIAFTEAAKMFASEPLFPGQHTYPHRMACEKIVPGTIAAVTKGLCRLIPRPQFKGAVQPEIQMKGYNVTSRGF